MQRWRFLSVLLFSVCVAGQGAVQGQTAGESTDIPRKQEESSPGGHGERRGRSAVQFIEKRPAWAKSPAEEADSETSPGRVPADVVRIRTCYGVQVGAFRSLENASKLTKRLSSEYGAAQTLVKALSRVAPLHRVVVGCEDELEEAKSLQEKLAENGTRGFVVKVEPDSPTPGSVE